MTPSIRDERERVAREIQKHAGEQALWCGVAADAVLALLFEPSTCEVCGGNGYDISVVYHGTEPRVPCPACVDGVVPSAAVWRGDLEQVGWAAAEEGTKTMFPWVLNDHRQPWHPYTENGAPWQPVFRLREQP